MSKARKEILIKSVLQAIPTCVMSCFKLPGYLLHELESLISHYWWGNNGKDKMHWVNWLLMCKSKRDGGLGFHDLRTFNFAFLGKQIWRIIQNSDSLFSRVYKDKYFPNCDIPDSTPMENSSFTWKSICATLELVNEGVRWRVGNCENIDI